MTSLPIDSLQLPAGQAACLRDIDEQARAHIERRLPPDLVRRSVESGRAIVADARIQPLLAPWTSRIDVLEAAEASARQQEAHQQTVFGAMSEHARQLFLHGARASEAAAGRAARATQSVSLLQASVLAAEEEAHDLRTRLAQTSGSLPHVCPTAERRPEEVDLSLETERAAAQAATGQLSALVALWAHDLGRLHEDGATICDLRHRFFTGMVRLQEDVWQKRPARASMPFPCGGAWFVNHLGGTVLLNHGRALVTEFQTASFALGQFYRESAARLSAQQTAMCREVEVALAGSLAQALSAAEQQAIQNARLATCQADVAAIRAQLTELAAEQLCQRAGLGCRPSEAVDAEAPQAGPTLRRA